MQSNESLGVLRLIFPSAPVVQGLTTACDWLEAPVLGHSPCHRFKESCPQGVLRTIRVVIQPESSGWMMICMSQGSLLSRSASSNYTISTIHSEILCATKRNNECLSETLFWFRKYNNKTNLSLVSL